MTRLWPSLLGAAQVVQPETILRWHRAGFKAFWRWKSRNRAGRPKIDRELRDLIQRMSTYMYDWNMLPLGQALWLKELETYVEFPPMQSPESYNLDQVIKQIQDMKTVSHAGE
ncbi:MAG TPA: hypothetical protein VMW05_00825 [Methyloceanibacter sp.]|nr:hypothetical protein [Methyloceanibacter sp.]